ncbi:hypothetical protein HXX76_003901 [Chlamydomonas incerta]|uniref:F-box domain-containing protein n=1 Tax=Chlamydomonas incerta TaxID=51695 RepID=A0A835TD42_CHLIN|nr:hypothetical protein HXX76_003901 [Chlamydomonas incerta]|eukprot:KAG2441048.1 hypothetical protein HXX76_003901 [Chlamydomonas incerta]
MATARRGAAGAPAGPGSAPSLPDVLRMLDMDAIATVFKSFSRSDLACARAACRGLRDACTLSVRRYTVRVRRRLACAWLARQRSPLSLFPWCQHVHVYFFSWEDSEDESDDGEAAAAAAGVAEDPEAAGAVEDDTIFMGPYNVYGHNGQDHHMARLALMGVSAEARGRITSLSLGADWDGSNGECLDLPGVVGVLAPQLPALHTLQLPELSTTSARSAFAALLHASLAAGAPALRELRLRCLPGILTGVGALAACGSLVSLLVSGGGSYTDGAVPLLPRLLSELSKLRSLETLEVCLADPSGGANLAALLGGRRPPALRTARLQVLAAAAAQLPDSSIGTFVIEEMVLPAADEQQAADVSAWRRQCLAPGSHLMRLLGRCGDVGFGSAPPLRLESATAEGVVREAVERLWLAATAVDAQAGEAGDDGGCDGGTQERRGGGRAVLLRVTEAAARSSATAAAGPGGGASGGAGGGAPGTEPVQAFAAAVLPAGLVTEPHCYPYPGGALASWAVRQVLMELWDRRPRDMQDGGGGEAADAGGSSSSRQRRLRPLCAGELENVRLLMELGGQVVGLWRCACGQRDEPS